MAKIDFRLVPEQDPHDILEKLQTHLASAGYSDIVVTAFAQADPVVTPIDDAFVKRIATIAESFAGKRPSITPIGGGTLPFLGDLRRYVGVPGLAAPDNPIYWGCSAHAPNEHIRLDDLDELCGLAVIYLQSWETSETRYHFYLSFDYWSLRLLDMMRQFLVIITTCTARIGVYKHL